MTDKNNQNGESGYYEPKDGVGQAMWKQAIVKKHAYPVKGGDDDAFVASNVKKAEQHKGATTGGEMQPAKKAVENVGKLAQKLVKESKILSEDPQAASADNPAQGQPAVDSGIPSTMAPSSDDNQTSPVAEMLEKIAMQAAEIHDELKEAGDLKDWVPATLQEVKDGLDQVYEYVVNGQDQGAGEDTGDDDQAPGKKSANEEYVAEDAPVKRGRGRPKKTDDASDSDAGSDHIIMQLRKVKSLKGSANKVRFKDGSAHHIHPEHAIKALAMHDSHKSSIEKEKFANRLGHSHAEFKDAIAGKPAKSEPTLYDKIVARRKANK